MTRSRRKRGRRWTKKKRRRMRQGEASTSSSTTAKLVAGQDSGLLVASGTRIRQAQRESRPSATGRHCCQLQGLNMVGRPSRLECKRVWSPEEVEEAAPTCHEHGCTTRASFGVVGSKKAELCPKHAKEGMIIKVVNKKCGHPGCTTTPSFGMPGSKKKAELCSKRAKEGMINVVNKKCGHPGCTTTASFGMACSRKREFCSKHAVQGMVNTTRADK